MRRAAFLHPMATTSLLALILAMGATARPSRAAVQLPSPAPACVQWAAGDVQSAILAAHVDPSSANVQVQVGGSPALGPESFRLDVAGGRVTVAGGDEVGAMYGLFELAEQIANGGATGSWGQVAASLSATEQHPFVEVRADNPFCQVKPLLIRDVAMWKAYIDNLARSRFNMLDLHGGYDLNDTSFPNLYPQLVTLPDYPDVGNRQEQAENLQDLKDIVAYAKQRGVQVALMNYSANVPALAADRIADYTSHAVAALLRAVPDLRTLGFRVGESGQSESFYRDAYLAGVAASGRKDVHLYTRSWGASQSKLEEIARAAAGGLDIEIKYNGEHLGLPYQAIQGGGGAYSYQTYIIPDAPYRIIWQVRANGTHRFWAWEDTDFIRRTVRTFRLGNARGFSLEPYIAYFTPYADAYYQSAADKRVYRYIWEKHWAWYFAWGRLSYNPDLSESTVVAAYKRHFGPAGQLIYAAVQAAGPIVPLAYSYRFPGPDQRDFSPETETGVPLPPASGAAGATTAVDPFAYGRREPMDGRSFVGIDEFVKDKARGLADGRIGPFRVAALFEDAAKRTRDAVDKVGALAGRPGDEWRLLRVDLLAASRLADFHAARIRGTVLTEWGANGQNPSDFEAGEGDLAGSRAAWKELAAVADATYAPLLNALRGQVRFRWGSLLAPLEEYDARVASTASAGGETDLDPGTVPRPMPHLAPRPLLSTLLKPSDLADDSQIVVSDLKQSVGSGKLTIELNAWASDGIAQVLLWYKPLPSESRWASVPLASGESGFSVSVPLPSVGMLYLVEARDRGGSGVEFEPALRATPYAVVEPWDSH